MNSISWAPAPPAKGIDGHWVKLGEVCVDSSKLAISDPHLGNSCYPVLGVEFLAGFGDGKYDVWGWIVDYGPDARNRIAQVVMTLIDEEDLERWQEDSDG